MRLLVLFLFILSNLAFADYKNSECYQEFKQAIDRQNERYKAQLKTKHDALIMNSPFYSLFKPELPKDYRREVLNILASPYATEFNKIFDYLDDPKRKKYSTTQIQAVIKKGFKEEEYCGFLKGFGAVKRYVKKHIDEQANLAKNIDDSQRSISSKEVHKKQDYKKQKSSVINN